MLNKIIEFCAENKFLVLILFFLVSIFSFVWLKKVPVDAIPDLSDTQVIVYSKYNKSPQIVEDQLTYPIVTALLGAPKVKTIRGFSDYGYSFVYVIFEDGTDIYWARSRVLEYMNKINSSLPSDAKVELGPDATGVGWIYQYVLKDASGKMSIDEIRSFQDFNLKYQLQTVEGVSEVATVGGFQKEYQITINPGKLLVYGISIEDIIRAVSASNNESDARFLEYSGFEYMLKVNGYLKNISDMEKIPLKTFKGGSSIFLKDVARITTGPQLRRGVSDYNGEGEAVSGIIVARHKANAMAVIERVKSKIKDIEKNLPSNLKIIPVYDRSELIKKSISTLKKQLAEEMIIVSLVIMFFLWHFPSAIVAIITIPVSVLLSIILMSFFNISSNIMSLSGIAISIGVLVDGAIIEVENAYKKLEIWQNGDRVKDFHLIRLEAIKEVIPSVFFSLLVIAVSFLPIFALTDQEGKLFSPLAWTKTLTMLMASFLALTLDPALRMSFSRMEYFNFRPKIISSIANSLLVGKYYKEETHPVSRILFSIYTPVCRFALKKPVFILLLAVVLVLFSIIPYKKLGSEFMPALNEGTILYMPTTLPGISPAEVSKVMKLQNSIIKSFPEVETVYAKAGRADTATDPAPLSMIETVVTLKPANQWREKKRWYSSWSPDFLKIVLRTIWYDKLTWKELIHQMDKQLKIPGFANAWTMPIKGRIDMLTTGVRTPVGIKVLGPDLKKTEEIALNLEAEIRKISDTRSVYAERITGGHFIEIEPNRQELARHSITISQFQQILSNTMGAMPITYTVEGRSRYPITLRYAKKDRENMEDLKNTIISVNQESHVSLSELAEVNYVKGPAMIRDENGLYSSYVYIDTDVADIGSYVQKLKKFLAKNVSVPSGYWLNYSGQYENMIRVKERLKLIIPLTLLLVFFLIFMNTKSTFKTFLVMSAIPFSLTGAFWFIYMLDYNISIAVWVGIIALAGLDAETGIFMLMYLDMSYKDLINKNSIITDEALKQAVFYGAVKRIRPKMMTVAAAFLGLIPIMWSLGTGSDVMKRIAAPMIGGLFTSFLGELIVYPSAYYLYIKRKHLS